MPHIPFHPAIGFGDLMDGWFVVPQNPIRDGGTPLVPSLQATQPNRILRKARLAELMPGAFTVPQNPLRTALGGGMGCGCSSGACGGGRSTVANYTLNGLGDWLTLADPNGYDASFNYMTPSYQSSSPGNYNMFAAPDYSQFNYSYGRGFGGLGQLDTSSVGNFISSIPTWLQEPAPLFPGVSNWVFFGGIVLALDLYMNKGRSGRGGGGGKR